MKRVIFLLIAVAILTGLWFGVTTWNRSRMLNSGRVVLLTNNKEGIYTYSDLIERDDITRAYDIVGYADELSQEEVAEATAGLYLRVDAETTPGDPRITPSFAIPAAIPEGTDEQQRWARAVATLSPQQSVLCAAINDPAFQQYCLARHIVYNGVKSFGSDVVCEPIFEAVQKRECLADVQSGDMSRLLDADGNTLLDVFETMAVPYEQRTAPAA